MGLVKSYDDCRRTKCAIAMRDFSVWTLARSYDYRFGGVRQYTEKVCEESLHTLMVRL